MSAPEEGSERSDAEVMTAVCNGDPSGLVELVRRYGEDLYAWARRALRDHHAAEDVAQDALLAVLRSAHTWNPERPLRPWLRVIVVNAARARLRKDARVSIASELPEPVDGSDPLEEMAAAEAAMIVRVATWELEPRARDALRMCYLDGLTHPEIARRMRRSVGSVSGLIRRAREELHLRLAERLGEAVA